MCRNVLASKRKGSWLTKASHVCTVKTKKPKNKNLALKTQTSPNPETK